MYCHPLPEGMKMDAYLLPGCCFSNCSPFLMCSHTPPKCFGTGEKKKKKPCHSVQKCFLEVEKLRLVVSSCLLFEVYYMMCRTLLRNIEGDKFFISLLPLLRSRWASPCSHMWAHPWTYRRLVICRFFTLTLSFGGFFGCFAGKESIEPFKCFSHWPNVFLPLSHHLFIFSK